MHALLGFPYIKIGAFPGFRHFFKRNAQFPGENFYNVGRAESALAASHAASGAAFDRIQSGSLRVPANGIDDFPFGDSLAAADDPPELGVVFDDFIFLGI